MKIEEIHHFLNRLYELSKDICEILDTKGIKNRFVNSPKNYIRINGKYELQQYPIPLIIIENQGDIGINLDGIFFEFFVSKESILNLELMKLQRDGYTLEIYGGDNCMVDYYSETISEFMFRERIRESREENFGIAFYSHTQDKKQIVDDFFEIHKVIINQN